ncbi:MAG: GTP-binding protein [Ilumatobacter sp.]|nr:GTP-binding protein [Ilumatobacter sp.]
MPYQEPEFLPWDGRRVPITFVGGYLGAGKTTAINALLAHVDRPIAVLVNDVGTINVDAALVGRRRGDTIELTDGCVCCSLIDGFGAAFDQLRSRPEPPDHVVVELSGLAEPERVVPWGSTAGFVLDGVVIIAAADQLLAAPDPVRTAIESQLTAADLIVLSKIDLADDARIADARRRVAEIAPGTPVVESARTGSLAIGSLLSLGGRRPGGVADVPAPTLFDAHDVRMVPLPGDLRLHDVAAAVDDALARFDGVVRAKGVVTPTDGPPQLIQVVGTRREITPLPEAEQQPATALTVISLRS